MLEVWQLRLTDVVVSSGGGIGGGGGGGVVMSEDEGAGHGENEALTQGAEMDGRIKRMVRVDDRGGRGRT